MDMVFEQSAVIPFRITKRGPQVLLITSRKGRWITPKGLVEDEHTPAESAALEAEEEAGVQGEVLEEVICSYSYRKWGGTCEVDVFLMKVTSILDRWDEDFFRERKWVTPAQAAGMIKVPEVKKQLDRFEELLAEKGF